MRVWFTAAGSAVVLVFFALGMLFGPDWYVRAVNPRTTGTIFVSGPQVYTRERLVNDRYREDAWLLAELDATPKDFGVNSTITVTNRDRRSVRAGVGSPPAPAAAAAPPPVAGAEAPRSATVSMAATPFDQLHARLAYRDQVRTVLIENQLDDRHDLRGNSLYRLRFDAAVLPGRNTQASVNIVVSILPPEGLIKGAGNGLDSAALRAAESELAGLTTLDSLSKPQAEAWGRIYDRWLDSLESRFGAWRKDLRSAYDANRFSPQEYQVLLRELRVDVTRLSQQIGLSREAIAQRRQAVDAWSERAPELLANIDADGKAAGDSDTPLIESFAADYRSKPRYADEITLGHKKLKEQTERLIRLIVAQNQYLRPPPLQQPSAEPTPGSAPPPNLRPAVTPANEDSCASLKEFLGRGDGGSQVDWGANNLNPGDVSLEYYMDRAFQGTLAKAVLGLEPELGGLRSEVRLDQIKELRPLASVSGWLGGAGAAFRFARQIVAMTVTSSLDCIPTERRNEVRPYKTSTGTVWAFGRDVAAIEALGHGYDVAHEVELAAAELGRPSPGTSQVVTRPVQIGLANFIRHAGRRLEAFSYAFTPSEPDQLTSRRSLDDRNRSLGARAAGKLMGADADGGVEMESQTGLELAGVEARKSVVGYGRQSTAATFGWLIQPQQRIDETTYRQVPSQTSLTALVSLPAWWDEVRLRVTRSWTDDDRGGFGAQQGQPEDYVIQLPVSFETVDATLFEQNDRSPVIHEWATEAIVVRACEPAEILIPGRRLWRSTVVTLGGQKANEIYVLPDMNGIIAKFRQVQVPSSWSDATRDFQAPVTVWTSQGSAPLSFPAVFQKMLDKTVRCAPEPEAVTRR